MNYIVFNKDGSIKNLNLPDIIVQGNNGVNEIYVAVEDYSNDAYTATAYFVLPNEDSNNISAIVSSFQIDDSTYQGYKIVLTSAQTALAGNVLMSLRLEGTNIAWTYNVILTINKSGYAPSLTQITMSQYENIISSLATFQPKYTLNNARFYASLEAAQGDIENLAINQMFIVADPSTPSVYPKLYFKQNATTLTELNTLGQFNSPSINVSTSTLSAGSNATAQVTASSSGNDWSLAFTFGIPKGDKGDKGNPGNPGADGTYVAYNLGSVGTQSALFEAAYNYFQTPRPYGQTCYGTISGVDYWFINSFVNGSHIYLTYINTGELCRAHYDGSSWKWCLYNAQEYLSFDYEASTAGLYAIEYIEQAGALPCTATISVTDLLTSAVSSQGRTVSGDEWHAIWNSATELFEIYNNGNKVTNPLGGWHLVQMYER